jgi:hypothetical protein
MPARNSSRSTRRAATSQRPTTKTPIEPQHGKRESVNGRARKMVAAGLGFGKCCPRTTTTAESRLNLLEGRSAATS